MIRFGWGLLLGILVGVGLALFVFAEPLCKMAVRGRVDGFLDSIGLSPSNPLRDVAHGLFS